MGEGGGVDRNEMTTSLQKDAVSSFPPEICLAAAANASIAWTMQSEKNRLSSAVVPSVNVFPSTWLVFGWCLVGIWLVLLVGWAPCWTDPAQRWGEKDGKKDGKKMEKKMEKKDGKRWDQDDPCAVHVTSSD